MNRPWANALAVMGLLAALTACGSKEEDSVQAAASDAEPQVDISAEVQAYYAAHPEFFSFKAPADIPAGLVWQDGMQLPELGSPEAKKGGTQFSVLADFPRTLRRAGPDSNGSFRPYILDYVDMKLAHRHGNEFDYFPGLAREWAVDMDNRTVYVRLNPAARWSDGEPVTSDDMLFMFFFFQSSYIVAPWYNNWYGTMYTNITRFDEHTFSITFISGKPDMDGRILELRPYPEHFYKDLGEDYVDRYQWRFQPTTGPYVIYDKDVKKGRSITLSRDDNWWARDNRFWRHRFNADKIHFTVIRDRAKRFEAFRRGDIDFISLDTAETWYEKLPDNDPEVQAGYIQKSVFYNEHPRPTYGLWINSARSLLDNRDVRVGINFATNWDLVIEKFFRGDFVRMHTASDGYRDFTHPTLRARPFDIDKAQAHFAAAGFTERGPDGVLVNSEGRRLSFGLSTGYEPQKGALTILKEEALKAGLEFRVEVLDATASWKKVQEKKHDIHFSAFNTFLEMYPRYWDHLHSDNAYDVPYLEDGSVNPARVLKTQTNNLESMAVPEMDRMIEAYRASGDKYEMIRLANAMDELHHEYASFVPAYVQDFYRLGHWRWVRFPEDFNVKHSNGWEDQFFLHWIDTDMKTETLEARKSGKTFEPQVKFFDQYRKSAQNDS